MNKPTIESAAAGFGNLIEMMKEKQSSWTNAFSTRLPINVEDMPGVIRACFLAQAIATQRSLSEVCIVNTYSRAIDEFITWKESLITNALQKKLTHLYELNDSSSYSSVSILTTDDSAIILNCSYEQQGYSATILSFDIAKLNELSNLVKGISENPSDLPSKARRV